MSTVQLSPIEESIKNAITTMFENINTHKSQRYIEYEFRIGHIFPDHYGTDLNRGHFDSIKARLDSMPKDICQVEYKEYKVEYDSDSRRRVDDNSDTIIKKSKLKNIDFMINNSPFDLRFSISKEQPVKLFGDVVKTFIKKRTSYKYKSWTYDLTITDEKDEKDKTEKTVYSIELEIDPKEFKKTETVKKLLYSTLMKINDLSKIVEDSEPGIYTLQ
jgi:hypothetical protein